MSQKGSSPVGWVTEKNCAVAKPREAMNAISRERRRVITDAEASTAGPLAVPETSEISRITVATGTGQRRR